MEGEALTAGRQALAAHVRSRIPALLAAWRAALGADAHLRTGDALPRVALEDHLPGWLDSFAAVLGAAPGEPAAEAAEARDAEAHGLQRWQQGYDLHEVTREWGCLHRCLVAELERFAAANAGVAPAAFAEARMKLARQIDEATSTSAEKYFRLERVEAAGNVRDLERALADLRELERRRAQLWQEAAHDLRGNLGVVSNVAQGLGFGNLPTERVESFLGLLRNNVGALHHLLDDVTALARLQAGQEQRRVAGFDAADLLRRLADDVRPLADAKKLSLRTGGPDVLAVEGDVVKVRRIAQNLLLNALKYTRAGGVTLAWSEAERGDARRWSFTVQDSGPGFHAGPRAAIVAALAPADRDDPACPAGAPDAGIPGLADRDAQPVEQAQGEGLGLAIVKRLCDLLDASVEIETVAAQGTLVRVFLPRAYPPAAA